MLNGLRNPEAISVFIHCALHYPNKIKDVVKRKQQIYLNNGYEAIVFTCTKHENFPSLGKHINK